MDMCGSSCVVPWVDGGNFNDALRVGEVPSTEEAVDFDVRGLASWVSAVDACGVACPELHKGVGHGLTGPAVDEANVEDDRDSSVVGF